MDIFSALKRLEQLDNPQLEHLLSRAGEILLKRYTQHAINQSGMPEWPTCPECYHIIPRRRLISLRSGANRQCQTDQARIVIYRDSVVEESKPWHFELRTLAAYQPHKRCTCTHPSHHLGPNVDQSRP